MKNAYMAMTIAGSDSCGGAGIQADLKTISAIGVFASSVITAVTSQNTLEVRNVYPMSEQAVASQIDAVLSDLPIGAAKIGMLHSSGLCAAVAEALTKNKFAKPLILDPVMVATSGDSLSKQDLAEAMVEHLFPLASLVTPNLQEAAVLAGMKSVETPDKMTKAAERLIERGARAVLVKGGHLESRMLTNVLVYPENGHLERVEFTSEKISSTNTHGTGCSLSAAIAAYSAMGFGLKEATEKAIGFVHKAIEASKDLFLGHGHGSLNHFFDPKKLIINEDIRQ